MQTFCAIWDVPADAAAFNGRAGLKRKSPSEIATVSPAMPVSSQVISAGRFRWKRTNGLSCATSILTRMHIQSSATFHKAKYVAIPNASGCSRCRPASIAFPRQVAMYLSREMTKGSLMEIGEAFGGRDHGTVIHACKKVTDRIATEPALKEVVSRLKSQLGR